MNLNKYTEKAQEAILAAQRLAEQSNHPQIDPEHLLLALAEQRDGIVPALLRKMSVDPKAVTDNLRGELSKQPAAYGGSQPAPSPRLRKVTGAQKSEAASTELNQPDRGPPVPDHIGCAPFSSQRCFDLLQAARRPANRGMCLRYKPCRSVSTRASTNVPSRAAHVTSSIPNRFCA
jgi:hypothetical protein